MTKAPPKPKPAVKDIKIVVKDGFNLEEIPKELLQYTNATEFVFSRNKLAKFPKEILKFPNLKKLDLSSNPFTEISAEISQLKNLKQIKLDYNHHTDLPASMAELKKLDTITMFYGYKMEKMPDVIAKIPSLKNLHFSRNDHLASIPKDIGNLKNLEYLNLNNCTKLKQLPESITQLTKLTHLDIGSTAIKKLPAGFEKLINLEKLVINNDGLDLEDAVEKIKKLPKLKYLTIMSQPKLPKSLKNLTSVIWLKVEENYPLLHKKHPTFPIPEEITLLSNLEYLDFTNCNLANALPKNIDKLSKLKVLSVGSTSIKNFPETLKKLKHLKQIEGSITRPDYPGYGITLEQKAALQKMLPKIRLSFF
jgi:Leucine-rich repeat (LRR) protein